MLEKYFDIEQFSKDRSTILFAPEHREKVAEVAGPVQTFLSTLSPSKDYIYLIVNALGANEWYGPNRNHDGFLEKELKSSHSTFVTDAKVYRGHKNKKGDPAYGDVLFSYYNPDMHRVELVISVKKNKLPDIAKRLMADEHLPLSMGTRVAYDVCSICGHKAKTVAEYCEHLQKPSIGKVASTGKKAYALNPNPRFFDISFVKVNADRTAYTMKKIAEHIEEKTSTIIKNIPATARKASKGEVLIRASQANVPPDLITKLTKMGTLESILRTFMAMRALPTKTDFQSLLLAGTGRECLADDLRYHNHVFTPTSRFAPLNLQAGSIQENIVNEILEHHPEMISSKPIVLARIIRLKGIPNKEIEIRTLEKIAALYNTFLAEFNRFTDHGPLTKHANLMSFLYPRHGLYIKSPQYAVPALSTYSSVNMSAPKTEIATLIEEILRQNSSYINQIYSKLT